MDPKELPQVEEEAVDEAVDVVAVGEEAVVAEEVAGELLLVQSRYN